MISTTATTTTTTTIDSKSALENLGGDRYYAYDKEKLKNSVKGTPWMTDKKYFKRVKISPSALTKMMMHGQSGVDKGIKAGGVPTEIMGLLLGYPDVFDPQCIIISDAQALPIEGFETTVVADNQEVDNFMVNQQNSNDLTRKDNFCGWYHTHPFDVDLNKNYSHAFLSSTDLTTQLQWQSIEDQHGKPFLAIVIDPLRSINKGRPELSAFRAYPPDYNPPANETPDGTIVTDDKLRVEIWGALWNRYYKLEVSYFMSNLAKTTLEILQNNFSWQNILTTTPLLEQDNQHLIKEQISIVSKDLESFDSILLNNGIGSIYRGSPSESLDSVRLTGNSNREEGGILASTSKISSKLSCQQNQEYITQLAKDTIFGSSNA